MITVLVESLPSLEGGESATIWIEGDTYRHLCRARRAEIGDRVRLTDGRGRARWSQVEAIDRKRARLRCGEEAPTREPARAVELWVGPLRSSRASWLVEKATELGVHAIRFFASENTARSYGPAGLARLERVAAAAVAQCHRAWCPPITGVHPWNAVLALGPGILLDPEAAPVSSVTPFTAPGQPVVILVGPEGGWSAAERRQLAAAGHVGLGLGQRVLRVETAALVGIVLVLSGNRGLSQC